jgi:hypothetical protein
LPRGLGKLAHMSTEGVRLGQYVLARRRELDATQMEIWQAGGPSNTTLTKIENGLLDSLQRKTARALDAGLQWEPGSAKRTWEGGEPTPLIPGVHPENSATLRHFILEADLDAGTREALLRVLDTA